MRWLEHDFMTVVNCLETEFLFAGSKTSLQRHQGCDWFTRVRNGAVVTLGVGNSLETVCVKTIKCSNTNFSATTQKSE